MSFNLLERLKSGYYDMRDMERPEHPKRLLSRSEMVFFEKQSETTPEAKELYDQSRAYFDAMNAYSREGKKRHDELLADLAQYHGLDADHEKTRKAFDLAWDYGHSNGFHEVASYFEDLVPLIKD